MNLTEIRRGARPAAPSGVDSAAGFGRAGAGLRMPLIAQYLSIARRRKWIILGAVAGALLISLLVTLLMTPQYTASAVIEIQRESRNFTRVQGVEAEEKNVVDLEFYQTQYGLLRARSLADRVATQQRLQDNAAFFEMFGKGEDWFEGQRLVPGASTREQRIREAGDILLDNLGISPERLSRLVMITFTSPDPAFSKRIVDAWGTHFIRATLERRFETTAHARGFLEERLVQLRARIDQSERSLVEYAAREGIVNLPAATPSLGEPGAATGERSLIADDLATLNRELGRATAERIQHESRLGSAGDTVNEALQNPAITGLRERRAELAAEYARMMVQFEPQYPPARALETQVRQLDRSIAREELRVRSTLRQTFQSSRQREQALEDRVDQLKSGVLDLRRRSIQYNILQRDVDTNRQLYDGLLQRYKEIGIAGGVGVNNISIVDQAELPEDPSSPRILLNILLGLIAGLIAGSGAALALEQIDEGLADPSEIEETLGVPLLGIIPRIATGKPLEELDDRKSMVAEAYMSVQTNLAFSTDHGIPKAIAVTSTRPAEGKSTTSSALATTLARAGRRTLLIDADMRSPSLHHFYNVENKRGLSNYLSGADDLASLIQPTSNDNMFVLSSGPSPPSAAELLSGDRLERLIAEGLKLFEHLVFDAPPIMGLADAPLLGSKVEGTIFVLESHRTKKSMARVAIARLRSANSQILGAVLTKFDAKRAYYGYGYDYGYSYGYGEPAESTT
ncbi:MAG TPA: polysaccharide biosynthesis tyrosine autokinase [Allosphingosinicella sp.]|nr:polysaccharide biosynthesis tyrosine autokinase [Allosphingosinicella sp.]